MQHAQAIQATTPNEIIQAAIRNAFPKDAEAILADLKYDTLNGNWYFWRHGVYVGVEHDGYIHS